MAESITPSIPIDNPDVPAGRKRFIPLENNPEVMNTLVHKLGLSKTLSFHDVFSIDDPDLLAFVPRPANALLLVFPVSATYEKYRMEEDAQRPLYEGKGAQEPVVWYRQTIGNACGLMGLLHAVSNGSAKDFIEPQSDLATLIYDAIPLAPTERADLLYNSEALEHAHQSAATQGQTSAPNAEDTIDLHYVCFVKDQATNQLWELDGRRKGPLNRGILAADDDVLSEKALELSVRKFIQREQATPGVAPAGSSTNSQADQYTKGALERSQLVPDPLTQFHTWFSHAQANSVHQPETVCLSTASLPSGRVSSRFVYLKELDSRGFVIYSNWGTSQKAKDVESNPWASLAFWWRELERQVRVEGRVERLTREESQVYFDTRIRGSKIGAWASRQSEPIKNREVLEGWVEKEQEKFEGQDKIPVPEFWGGLRVIPDKVEFWQGRESRLHDRFVYEKLEGVQDWKIFRLSP